MEVLRPTLRRARVEILVVLALVGLGLGWWGFDRYFDQQGAAQPWRDDVYHALGLFAFEGGRVEGPVPWQLEIARFLTPLVVLAAAVGAFFAVFDREWQRLRARYLLSGHIVVVGLGTRGLKLALNVVDAGIGCAVVEMSEEAHPNLPNARRAGIAVITTDGVNPELLPPGQLEGALREAAVGRAEAVIVTTESARLNARVTNAISRMQARGAAPRAFVEIPDTEALRALQILPRRGGGAVTEYYNLAERGGKALLDAVDERLTIRTPDQIEQHLVVVGDTELARNVAVQATRNWSRDLGHYGFDVDAWRRPLITIVVADEDGCVPLLRRLEPRIGVDGEPGVCSLSTVAGDASAFLSAQLGRPPSAVVVTAADEGSLLTEGLALARAIPRGTPLWICAERSDGLADLLAREHAPTVVVPAVFHVDDSVLRHDEILRGVDEELARALHQTYRRYRKDGELGTATPDGLRPWHELHDDYKRLNRRVVARWREVLDEEGCDLVPYERIGAESDLLEPRLVQALAAAYHQAWADEKRSQGVRYGPGKDDVARTHPLLVPWDELDSASQSFNLAQASCLPQLLAVTGMQLEPGGRSPA